LDAEGNLHLEPLLVQRELQTGIEEDLLDPFVAEYEDPD
jgi:hypothetical protein